MRQNLSVYYRLIPSQPVKTRYMYFRASMNHNTPKLTQSLNMQSFSCYSLGSLCPPTPRALLLISILDLLAFSVLMKILHQNFCMKIYHPVSPLGIPNTTTVQLFCFLCIDGVTRAIVGCRSFLKFEQLR